MPKSITTTLVSRDKFVIISAYDGSYLGDVMLSCHGGFRFFPSPSANAITEDQLTRITRLLRRQNRILTRLNQLSNHHNIHNTPPP